MLHTGAPGNRADLGLSSAQQQGRELKLTVSSPTACHCQTAIQSTKSNRCYPGTLLQWAILCSRCQLGSAAVGSPVQPLSVRICCSGKSCSAGLSTIRDLLLVFIYGWTAGGFPVCLGADKAVVGVNFSCSGVFGSCKQCLLMFACLHDGPFQCAPASSLNI